MPACHEQDRVNAQHESVQMSSWSLAQDNLKNRQHEDFAGVLRFQTRILCFSPPAPSN